MQSKYHLQSKQEFTKLCLIAWEHISYAAWNKSNRYFHYYSVIQMYRTKITSSKPNKATRQYTQFCQCLSGSKMLPSYWQKKWRCFWKMQDQFDSKDMRETHAAGLDAEKLFCSPWCHWKPNTHMKVETQLGIKGPLQTPPPSPIFPGTPLSFS